MEQERQRVVLSGREQDDGGRRLVGPGFGRSPSRAYSSSSDTPSATPQTIPNYDVSPDGQRFVMVKDDSASGRLNIVLNWTEELKRLVPTR